MSSFVIARYMWQILGRWDLFTPQTPPPLTIREQPQKGPSRRGLKPCWGFLKKRCSENMQQIYSWTPITKCDFNEIVLQPYWNPTSGWVFFSKFVAYFQNAFFRKTPGRLLLNRSFVTIAMKFSIENMFREMW